MMNIYNERLINIYTSSFYNKLLNNSTEYKNLISERMSRFSPNSKARCSTLSRIDALDNYIAKCVLEHPEKLDPKAIVAYRDYVYSLFQKHPLIVTDSILFKKEIVTRLFSPTQATQIEEYKKNLTSRISIIATKISNKEQITKQEHDQFLMFLISQIDNHHPKMQTLRDNMFGLIMQKPENLSLLAKEFIFKYVASNVAKENNIPPVQVYISDDLIDGASNEKVNGCSFGNSSVLMINREYAITEQQKNKDIDPVVKMIHTIAHETRHSKQAYEAANKIVSFSSIEYIRNELFGKYLSSSEYRANYRHSEIERDSNLYGWTYTIKLLERFNPSLVKNLNSAVTESIKHEYKSSFGNKRNSTQRKPKDIYNVHYLDKIIAEHPEELNNYPQLQLFYNPDGSKKDIMSIIATEERTNTTSQANIDTAHLHEIFDEYYFFALESDEITSIHINSLAKEQQFALIAKMSNLLSRELENLNRTIKMLSTQNKVEFENINRYRLKRISKLLKYFDANRQIVDELIKQDIALGNPHALGFTLSTCSNKYESIKKKIGEDESLKDTAIYDALQEFSEGAYGHGPRF